MRKLKLMLFFFFFLFVFFNYFLKNPNYLVFFFFFCLFLSFNDVLKSPTYLVFFLLFFFVILKVTLSNLRRTHSNSTGCGLIKGEVQMERAS